MDFFLQLDWFAIMQIMLIDILLGGDNAIVIALACRNLPQHLRFRGILWGTSLAIIIRIGLVLFAVALLKIPYIKIVCGLLLLWVGVKLITQNNSDINDTPASDQLYDAIKTILIADIVMSVDNVIGVSSAAELSKNNHQFILVTFGIFASVPIIIWGSTLVLNLMQRFPIIINAGAALLGYLAGGIITSDIVIEPWITTHMPYLNLPMPFFNIHLNIISLFSAALIIIIGWAIKQKSSFIKNK